MRFIFVRLSVLWIIYGQTIAREKITIYDNYKILQGITERMEIMEEKVNSLVSVVSRMGKDFEKLDNLFDAVSKIGKVFDCGKPTISNGQFWGNSTYTNDVMVASCDEGFSLHGKEKITCTADRKWTTIPVCKPICKSPRVPNSRQFTEDTVYPMGSQVIIQCNHGYEKHIMYRSEIRCVWEGKWSDLWTVSCTPVDCNELTDVSNGAYNDGYTTTFNTTITLTCDEGFEKVGSEPFYCNGDGHWVGGQSCMRRVCVPVNGNSTECYYKYYNFRLFPGFVSGEMSATEDESCITKCLEHDRPFSFIEYSLDICTCFERTLYYGIRRHEPGVITLIKESMLKTLSLEYKYHTYF
ncbi:C4b-binding protein alpha [Mactra antiquata]